MHVVILSPIGNHYFHVTKWIDGDTINEYSLIVQERHIRNYKNSVCLSNVDFYSVKDWNQVNIINKIIKIKKRKFIDKIFTYTEEDIELAALIRENLKIPGQNLSSAMLYRNKYQMKKLVSSFGFKTPDFKLITNYFDLLNFVEKSKFPVIIKPIDGAGGAGCRIISNKVELNNIELDYFDKPYLVEKFIDSTVYHIDGLLLNGELKYVFCSEYLNNCLSYQKQSSTISIQLNQDGETYLKLKQYTQELIPIFSSPPNCLFHLEVFYDGNEIVFCEIACRMGGGRIKECIEDQFGFDPIEELLKCEVGNVSYFDKHNKALQWEKSYGWVCAAPKKGKIIQFPKLKWCDEVFDYYIFASEGKVYNELNSCIENVCAFSVKCDSEEQLRNAIIKLDNEYRSLCEYEKE